MTIRKALHSKDYVDRLCLSRKGGRGLASIQVCVDTSIQRLEESTVEDLITAAGKIETTQESTEQKYLENRNGTKYNSMDTSSEKQVKSQTRRP